MKKILESATISVCNFLLKCFTTKEYQANLNLVIGIGMEECDRRIEELKNNG